jgi:hypothetical protein
MSVISMDTLIENIDKNFPPEVNTFSKKNQTLKRRINLIFNQIMTGFEGERRRELIEHLLQKINRLSENAEDESLLSTNEVDLILGNIVAYLETHPDIMRGGRKTSKRRNRRRSLKRNLR